MQLCTIIYYSLPALHVLSNIFAHNQEHLNCITASVIIYVCRCQLQATYVCNTRRCNTIYVLLMMSENIARNMQSRQGIINYPTQLHLVGHFRILCLLRTYVCVYVCRYIRMYTYDDSVYRYVTLVASIHKFYVKLFCYSLLTL